MVVAFTVVRAARGPEKSVVAATLEPTTVLELVMFCVAVMVPLVAKFPV